MATLSTASLNWLAAEWAKLYKTAVLSGIVGDLAHKARGGYHISREDQGSGNYSVIRADDKPGNGPNDRAAAIDMTMSTADIILCHTRLRTIWKNRASDPRMKYINAWNGWDGQGDAGRYDVITGNISTATSDHKWHIHLEIRRKYVNDMDAMRAILSMLKGEPAPSASPTTPATGGKDMTKDEVIALLKTTEARLLIASAVWNVDNVISAPGSPAPGKNPDGTDVNTHWTAASYLQTIHSYAIQSKDALGKDVNVNEDAIATAILANPALINTFAAAVAAKIPTGVQVTPAQLTAAFKTALREGVAS